MQSSQTTYILYLIAAVPIFTLLCTLMLSKWISEQKVNEEKIKIIGEKIAKGALSFLKEEYKVIAQFLILFATVLFLLSLKTQQTHSLIILAFLSGAILSGLSGFIGMKIATNANVKTAQAAKNSLAKAFNIAFAGGSIMGLGVTSLAMLGLTGLFALFIHYFMPQGLNLTNRHMLIVAIEALTGFSLGAESVALFARVAGGIYTKAADVGADIVGKIESDIPEDDPRNPATIADNVGDNVGDVAGMGADLFGSYVSTILAAMVLGTEIHTLGADRFGGLSAVILPLLLSSTSILLCMIAMFATKMKTEEANVQSTLNKGIYISTLLTAISSFFIIKYTLPHELSIRSVTFKNVNIFYSVITGLAIGILISTITEYFTSMDKKPVKFIAKQSVTGHATNIIAGLGIGMLSITLPIIMFAIGIYISFHFAGFYGVAMAATGMMATTTIQLAVDAFGPIADNAGGIAEMGGLPKETRERTDILDTVGNTTAATGKGFAIASAALTSLALLAAFAKTANIKSIDIYKAPVLSGLFLGGIIPFVFSALTINAVGKAAMAMVHEVRRQFTSDERIIKGQVDPDYEKCIEISTKYAIKEMILPGAIAIITPIVIGFLMGPEVLASFLAGVTTSGVTMAIFQCNAGGAWDNAKKSFEKGINIEGQMFYKGSEAHKASVTGDTVGDPFKDTSGPSMNILIKLVSIVALIIAPYLG
jgi:K(+)-stimulated pyrophosphate-energized sodium pump